MGESDITPVLETYDLVLTDRFLLCSDGLHGFVDEKTMEAGMKISEKSEALTYLIEAAFASGAPDNVTVLIADLVAGQSEESDLYLGAAHHE